MSTKIRLDMKPINTILTRLGINKTGDVQLKVTNIINHRITQYMPYRTGVLATKSKYIKSATEIEVVGKAATYLYYGKVMVNAKTGKGPMNIPGVGLRYKKGTILKATDRDLQYDKTKNPQAGPYWDRRMMDAEGAQIVKELQTYIDRKAGK